MDYRRPNGEHRRETCMERAMRKCADIFFLLGTSDQWPVTSVLEITCPALHIKVLNAFIVKIWQYHYLNLPIISPAMYTFSNNYEDCQCWALLFLFKGILLNGKNVKIGIFGLILAYISVLGMISGKRKQFLGLLDQGISPLSFVEIHSAIFSVHC